MEKIILVTTTKKEFENDLKNNKYKHIRKVIRVHKGVHILKTNIKSRIEKIEFQVRF